ncbi:hypothetical protein FEM48_Zijuj04G0193300 [Ziziphus jujuba var. spinosa]|uniref:Uncharacterized protein n=1 Tax=Ziziphus jujuba var. spinosa TaxID=714518 RepID=A0A978VLQ0_ZIZJJ|nr:hypothetical protein FEM48_Zijuj04G0193300 [Ziziphus jujuba var. spinosa]
MTMILKTEANKVQQQLGDQDQHSRVWNFYIFLFASFDNLELLVLESLPSLTSFNMGNCAMQFPKLSRVVVAGNRPELRSFCGHGSTITTPKLTTFVRRRTPTYRNIYAGLEHTDSQIIIHDRWLDSFAADAEADDKIELLEEECSNININTTIQEFWENHLAQN